MICPFNVGGNFKDCGIDENLELEPYKKYEKWFFPPKCLSLRYIKEADIILISHSEREYSGALYFLFNNF